MEFSGGHRVVFATTSFQRPHEEAHKSSWSLSRSNFSVVQFSSGVRKVDFFWTLMVFAGSHGLVIVPNKKA